MLDPSRIFRVFPRRTAATPPPGPLVWVPSADYGAKQLEFPRGVVVPGEVEEIHVSVVFTWDLPYAEMLAESLKNQGRPVKIGGPATGMRGEEFTPGLYMKEGYIITSRGCPNRCFFCEVWKRDGTIRELEIKEGWNVSDDNILATSGQHFRAVMGMLSKYGSRAEFTGGLEAKILKQWHVDLLAELRPKQMFFAYDTPDDYEPLVEAGKMLRAAGFQGENGEVSRKLRSFVLIGYPRDTIEDAEKRMWQTLRAGFLPMAMLFRHPKKNTRPSKEWRTFQRSWARPAAMANKLTGVEVVKPEAEADDSQFDLFPEGLSTCGVGGG